MCKNYVTHWCIWSILAFSGFNTATPFTASVEQKFLLSRTHSTVHYVNYTLISQISYLKKNNNNLCLHLTGIIFKI